MKCDFRRRSVSNIDYGLRQRLLHLGDAKRFNFSTRATSNSFLCL